jgi:cation:H+ antiporter
MFETYSFITYIIFIAGFLFLIKGADFLIKGSTSVAQRFGLSEYFIGLTIVSFGTSLPEFVVSFVASMKGNNAIALGNVLGSNIANTLLITGAIGIVAIIVVKTQIVFREIPFSILIIGVLAWLSKTNYFSNKTSQIDFYEGIILLILFLFFLRYTFRKSKIGNDKVQGSTLSIYYAVIYIVVGVAGLFFGGKWTVNSAIIVAEKFGISQAFIGLTIVALGTSLPELITSLVAAYRKNNGIAIGDMLAVAVAGFLIMLMPLIGKKHEINKSKGIFLITTYVGYILYLVFRETIL